MTNVVFMFGAGAECSFDFLQGNEFMKETIFAENPHTPKEVMDSLSINNNLMYDTYFKKRVICNLMMQYINVVVLENKKCSYKNLSNKVKDMLFTIYSINKSYVSSNLGALNIIFEDGEITSFKDNKDNCSDSYYKYKNLENILNKYLESKDSEKDEIKLEEKYQKIYDNIKNNNIKICADGIDKYFISINNPIKYGINNYSKIINLYWSIYYTMTTACLTQFDNSKGFELNDDSTIEDIIRINNFIWNKDNIENSHKCTDNYYSEIYKYMGHSLKAITTNYTPFAYLMFHSTTMSEFEDNISYLNGRLDMFENFDELSIKSSVQNDDNTYDMHNYMKKSFSFLLAQSMIKPVIHPFQIKEFYKATTFLENADYFVVLGYGLNEDDNHVNALLKEYITENMTVIIVVKNEDDEEKLRNMNVFSKTKDSLMFVHYENKSSSKSKNKSTSEVVTDIFDIINNN